MADCGAAGRSADAGDEADDAASWNEKTGYSTPDLKPHLLSRPLQFLYGIAAETCKIWGSKSTKRALCNGEQKRNHRHPDGRRRRARVEPGDSRRDAARVARRIRSDRHPARLGRAGRDGAG